MYRDVSDSISFFFFSAGGCYYFLSRCSYCDVFIFVFGSRKLLALLEPGVNCSVKEAGSVGTGIGLDSPALWAGTAWTTSPPPRRAPAGPCPSPSCF